MSTAKKVAGAVMYFTLMGCPGKEAPVNMPDLPLWVTWDKGFYVSVCDREGTYPNNEITPDDVIYISTEVPPVLDRDGIQEIRWGHVPDLPIHVKKIFFESETDELPDVPGVPERQVFFAAYRKHPHFKDVFKAVKAAEKPFLKDVGRANYALHDYLARKRKR